MIGLFLLAGAVRLMNMEAPGLALDREYRSALIARAYYFEMAGDVPQWRRDVASASMERQGILEPPVMELLVALTYRVVGGEHLWMAAWWGLPAEGR